MALSTTDLGTAGSGLPKTITPGNHVLKINSIELEDFKFIDGAYHLSCRISDSVQKEREGSGLRRALMNICMAWVFKMHETFLTCRCFIGHRTNHKIYTTR